MAALYIGIDPGATGAIALIDTVEGRFEVADMPLVVVNKAPKKATRKTPTKGKRKKPAALVDGRRLAKMLSGLDPAETFICIEKVGAMPGQGVTSMFNFGNSAGVVRGVCEALGFDIKFVTPQQWKKSAGLLRTEKDESRVLAIKKYPALAPALKRKRDGGRADALFIAQYRAHLIH